MCIIWLRFFIQKVKPVNISVLCILHLSHSPFFLHSSFFLPCSPPISAEPQPVLCQLKSMQPEALCFLLSPINGDLPGFLSKDFTVFLYFPVSILQCFPLGALPCPQKCCKLSLAECNIAQLYEKGSQPQNYFFGVDSVQHAGYP